MKHYKGADGEVYAFAEDGSQDALIRQGLQPLSAAEVQALRAPKGDHIAQKELADAKMEITPLLLAEAIVSGDIKPLEAILKKLKNAKAKLPK